MGDGRGLWCGFVMGLVRLRCRFWRSDMDVRIILEEIYHIKGLKYARIDVAYEFSSVSHVAEVVKIVARRAKKVLKKSSKED